MALTRPRGPPCGSVPSYSADDTSVGPPAVRSAAGGPLPRICPSPVHRRQTPRVHRQKRTTFVRSATLLRWPSSPTRCGKLAAVSRDAEDEDHTTFLRLEYARNAEGEGPVLSRAGFQLHSHATIHNVQSGSPGFVADDDLNAIAAETSITATELCLVGMWHRVEGGYELLDQSTVDIASDQSRKMDEDRKLCHRPRAGTSQAKLIQTSATNASPGCRPPAIGRAISSANRCAGGRASTPA
jgi:hypothetical protein